MAGWFEPRESGFDHLLGSRNGPVGIYIRKLGEETAEVARGTAPVGSTGKMRDRIKCVWHGRIIRVVVDVDYALAVIRGSKPHVIRPKQDEFLKFPTAAGVIFTPVVQHPGTRGNDFLMRALRRVVK